MANNTTGTLITLGIVGAAAWALYEWLSSECSTSGSSLYGGTVCGFLTPLGIGTPAPASTPATTTTTSSTSPASTAPAVTTAVLTNLTAPGQPFAAGDSFQLVVTGPANSQVTGTASQNGAVTSSTNFGTTNASGQLVITGGWDSTDVGSWVESWQVGSATPAPLTFNIGAAGVAGLRGINRIPMGVIHRGQF